MHQRPEVTRQYLQALTADLWMLFSPSQTNPFHPWTHWLSVASSSLESSQQVDWSKSVKLHIDHGYRWLHVNSINSLNISRLDIPIIQHSRKQRTSPDSISIHRLRGVIQSKTKARESEAIVRGLDLDFRGGFRRGFHVDGNDSDSRLNGMIEWRSRWDSSNDCFLSIFVPGDVSRERKGRGWKSKENVIRINWINFPNGSFGNSGMESRPKHTDYTLMLVYRIVDCSSQFGVIFRTSALRQWESLVRNSIAWPLGRKKLRWDELCHLKRWVERSKKFKRQ